MEEVEISDLVLGRLGARPVGFPGILDVTWREGDDAGDLAQMAGRIELPFLEMEMSRGSKLEESSRAD